MAAPLGRLGAEKISGAPTDSEGSQARLGGASMAGGLGLGSSMGISLGGPDSSGGALSAGRLVATSPAEVKNPQEINSNPVQSTDGREDSGIYHYHNDPNGCPMRITDVMGNIVWSATYAAWGQIHRLQVDAIDNPLRFQGQYYDDDTDLYYNRYRYYDHNIGQYISHDPIKLAGGDNLYRYTINPIRWADPLGLHEAIGWLNGDPVLTPNGGYSWYSTPGSSKAAFNGFGAKGHSEAKMLEHLEKLAAENKITLTGSSLTVTSMGQITKGGRSSLSTLPPCDNCAKGLQAFAEKHGMDVTYKWDGGEKKFLGCKK
jgi:RHS repeat-associated protein